MARPKGISDEQLFSALDTFWLEECHEVPAKLNSKRFALYLQQNGYSMTDSALRHNSKAMERINRLKDNTKAVLPSSGLSVVPGKPGMKLSYDELLGKYEQMQKFICETYVNGICSHFVQKELSVTMDSPVKAEAVEQNVISAGMNPFTSPVVKKLANLFDLEDGNE